MPDRTKLAGAQLIEVELGNGEADAEPVPQGRTATVQFNPESLKLAYTNNVERSDATGSGAMQFIASSSTRLDVELWFDASVDAQSNDVRQLTKDVHYFITPQRAKDRTKFKIPSVRFLWGAFLFDGVVTSLNETLEFFSTDGRPLRARIALGFAAQNIQFRIEGLEEATGGAGPGRTPQTLVKEGDSVQQVAARGGSPGAWKAVAAANDIDNPRRPAAGSFISTPTGRR